MKNKLVFILAWIVILAPSLARSEAQVSDLLYSPTTSANLAKSYWLLNNLDTSKNQLIDQYLMITECDLFRQFYKNDLEWDKIRDATRGYIKANKSGFPSRFEFVQPIFLNRYDSAAGSFDIMPKFQLVGVKQMEISGNRPNNFPCINSDKYNPHDFPLNAIVTLSRPVNYTSVKATRAAADEYIKYIDEKNLNEQSGRPAYIRFRFKIEQSLTPINSREVYANFFGGLESMTVFGDKDLFIKLEEQKF